MTFALLVIFVFILQVLFRHGMSSTDVDPGISQDYHGYEGCSELCDKTTVAMNKI